MTEWLRYPEGIWPSLEQELLIRACVSTGGELTDAWQQWRSQVDIDLLDTSSHRLLPTLYRNLKDHDIQDPLMDRLRSVYRLAWYKNQLLVDSAAEVISILEQAGIKTMLLKGIGMYGRGDMEIASRHMFDADILIPYSQIENAISIMNQHGWQQAYTMSYKVYSLFRHSIGFSRGAGREVDLHWNIYFSRLGVNPDLFWDRAIPVKFAQLNTSVMDPGDSLMFACYHGACWNFKTLHLDWVSDALLLLNLYRNQINWERMVDQAGQLRVGYTIWNTYTYLNQTFNTRIPNNVIAEMKEIGRNNQEIKEFKIKERTPKLFLTAIQLHALNYLYFANQLNIFEKIWKFPRFIQSIMQVNRIVDIPIALVKKVLNKLFRITDTSYLVKEER